MKTKQYQLCRHLKIMNKNTISKQCLQVLDVKSAKMKKKCMEKKLRGLKMFIVILRQKIGVTVYENDEFMCTHLKTA